MPRTITSRNEPDGLMVEAVRFLPLLAHGRVAAALLAMHPANLCSLGTTTHKIFKPVKRVFGAKRPVYTNYQMVAIKKVMLGHMDPDDAYKAFMDAEWEEANRMAELLDRDIQPKNGSK